MAPKLNEDVLRLIFDYFETPLQWIQLSEVCQLWKTAASKHWIKITEINYLKTDLDEKVKPGDLEKAPVISAKAAKRIVKCAAPFVRVLSASENVTENDDQFVMFGSFLYKVRDFDPDEILLLLIQNARKITEFSSDEPPEQELLELLIDTNNIKTVRFENCNNFYEDVPTDEIEELTVQFIRFWEIKSFEGHFPNLKKLDLKVQIANSEGRRVFSKILPHIVRVTSIRLQIEIGSSGQASCKSFLDIAKLTKLENLSLIFRASCIEAAAFFFKKLAKGCPKLRAIELHGMRIYHKQLQTLLSLPQLEKLNISSVSSLESMNLPVITNLTHLKMVYNRTKLDVASFCKALKKMPNLKVLEMRVDFMFLFEKGKPFKSDETFHLVCEVVLVVASQNRNIVLQRFGSRSDCIYTTLNIVRRNEELSDREVQQMNLIFSCISFYRKEEEFLKCIKKFVRENVTSHRVVVVESEQD